jgi:hypothetical protein
MASEGPGEIARGGAVGLAPVVLEVDTPSRKGGGVRDVARRRRDAEELLTLRVVVEL